ncbi:MAG: hypothetical protein ABF289_04870 [Clostridiales bacterium]
MSEFDNNSNIINNTNEDNSFSSSKKSHNNNPYQTKQIGKENNDFFTIEKKHYFNNEYAKRNIIVLLSTLFIITIFSYFVFFSSTNKEDSSNYQVTEDSSKKSDNITTLKPIEFSDTEFKKYIISKLELNDTNVFKEDIDKVKEIEITSESKIKSLSDLSLFENLNKVILKKDISDIDTLYLYDSIEVNLSNINFNNLSVFENIMNIKEFEGKINPLKSSKNDGVFIFNDNSIYDGKFSDGIIKGKGTYTYPNKGKLIGKFNDIDFSGEAKFFYENEKKLFEGLFDGKYTTKSLSSNFFDGILTGTFYTNSGNKLFVGKYTGQNTLKDNYFDGKLDGTFISKSIEISGIINGKITTTYTDSFSYELNGNIKRNSEKTLDGNFNITVLNQIESKCSGDGFAKLPKEMNLNGLMLEGTLEYDVSRNQYNVVGESYRILNNSKVYEDNNTIQPTESPTETPYNEPTYNPWWQE